jgi:hypothetical protein
VAPAGRRRGERARNWGLALQGRSLTTGHPYGLEKAIPIALPLTIKAPVSEAAAAAKAP